MKYAEACAESAPKTLRFVEYLNKFNSYNFKLYFKSVLFM